jgi:hypothetical protein
MEDAVKIDPDVFEGTEEDGAGPGPHFITMSFSPSQTPSPF